MRDALDVTIAVVVVVYAGIAVIAATLGHFEPLIAVILMGGVWGLLWMVVP